MRTNSKSPFRVELPMRLALGHASMAFRHLSMAALLGLLAVGVTGAQEEELPAAPPTPEEEFRDEIDLAERLGATLFAKVKLAEEATAAAELVVDRRTFGLAQGPIVVEKDGQWLVRFVGSAGARVISHYDVLFSLEGVPKVRLLDSPRNVTAREASLFVAKQAATRAMPFRCPADYVRIGLPSLEGRGWTIYLLPEPKDENLIQLGGHIRAEVSHDGEEVKTIGALASGCKAMAADGPGEAQGLGRAEGLDSADGVGSAEGLGGFWAMHTRSPTPHEIHVYLSLRHDLAMKVGTWTGAWSVDQGEVEFAYTWENRPR